MLRSEPTTAKGMIDYIYISRIGSVDIRGRLVYLDLRVHGRFLPIVLLILIRVHADIVESKLLLDAILEQLPLLQRQAIRLGNHRHHIDRLAQLL